LTTPVHLLLFTIAVSTSLARGNEPDDFLIIAHRGAAGYAPENTLAAFKKAIEIGANVLETDIRQTRDGHLVAMHDASVDRTTDGKGDVGELTLEEVKRLDAGSWFSEAFGNERVPTLEEIARVLNDTTRLIIEIKGDSTEYPGIEERVVDQVMKLNIGNRVVLKSFDAEVLARLRKLAPDIPQLFVYALRVPWIDLVIGTGLSRLDVFELPVQYLQPHAFFVTESFTRSAHEQGYRVIAWDVHDERRMSEMLDLGVDGIETDFPDLLKEVVTSRQIQLQE